MMLLTLFVAHTRQLSIPTDRLVNASPTVDAGRLARDNTPESLCCIHFATTGQSELQRIPSEVSMKWS